MWYGMVEVDQTSRAFGMAAIMHSEWSPRTIDMIEALRRRVEIGGTDEEVPGEESFSRLYATSLYELG